MKCRALAANGDYVFGGATTWLKDSPAAVAQAVGTRLALMAGTWFLDHREGLDLAQVLGYNTSTSRDIEIQSRISGTNGLTAIVDYQSTVNNRSYSVTANVDTLYGPVTIKEAF